MIELMSFSDPRPFFFVHQSYQQRKRLPECIDYVNRRFHNNLRVGTITRLPTLSPKRAKEYINKCSDHTDLVIVDPELYTHRENLNIAKKTAAKHSFMSNSLPSDFNSDDIDNILQKQREFGATILLTPSLFIDNSRPREDLLQHLNWAREAKNLVDSDEILMINLTLNHHWLQVKELRTLLLNELMDINHEYFYIRVLWPTMRPRYGQLRDINILNGYKELAMVMNSEERIVVFPTTNLTGWVATSLGAGGFSMGPSKDQQCFAFDPEFGRIPGQSSPQRKNRYFSETLLHVIDLHYHDTLISESNYLICDCKFCQELKANDINRTAWDHEASSLHQIVATAKLTARLSNRNPRNIALREVRKATGFVGNLNKLIKPTGENVPSHLAIWESLLV